jgi:peptidyl-prolyl cis-trans isomerase D
MLQNMRDNMKGTIAFIIVGFLAFILAASLVNLTGTGQTSAFDEVTEVNGRSITEREVQLAIGQERQRLQAQFGDGLPADFLSDERLRAPVLQGLIQRSALLDKALKGKMGVSDGEIDTLITELPDFQVDGVFNPDLFVSNVRRLGHTPVSFRTLLRDDVVTTQLRNSILTSAFVTDQELKKIVALTRQTRDFSWVRIPLGDLQDKVTVSDEELQAYYDENKTSYNTEEKVAVEYIEIKVSDFEGDIEVSDEDIRQQYEQELKSADTSEEREAAHILIEGDDEAAKTKIAEVQSKLAAGEDFAELAKAYSDDFGSRDNGGNLGFTRGDTFPQDFESALASLEEGQVSEPVEIDGVTHIIKLVSLKASSAPSFEESSARIAGEIKRIQAEEIFVENLTALKDLAYNAENLQEVAEQLNLQVKTTQLFTRLGGIDPVLRDQRVIAAAFSDQVLQQGYTSEVLELAADNAVVLNLTEHEPVRTLSFDEKRSDMTAELKLSKAKEQLQAQVKTYVSELENGKALTVLAEENEYTVNAELALTRSGSYEQPELLEHVFSLPRPAGEQPQISTVFLNDNDYALISLTKVADANFDELTEEEKQGIRLQLARSTSISEFNSWQDLLVSTAKIEGEGEAAPSNL